MSHSCRNKNSGRLYALYSLLVFSSWLIAVTFTPLSAQYLFLVITYTVTQFLYIWAGTCPLKIMADVGITRFLTAARRHYKEKYHWVLVIYSTYPICLLWILFSHY